MADVEAGAFHKRQHDADDFEGPLTIDATVGGVALTPSGSQEFATITVETALIRWTRDTTAPTTTVGHLAGPGDVIVLDSNEDIVAFRAIRVGSTSGTLQTSYDDMKLTSA